MFISTHTNIKSMESQNIDTHTKTQDSIELAHKNKTSDKITAEQPSSQEQLEASDTLVNTVEMNRIQPSPTIFACPTIIHSEHSDCQNQNENNLEVIWTNAYDEMLKEVIATGSVQPKYKMGCARRTYNVVSTTICCSTVCSACLAWDCVCCCLGACCKSNPFRWGCAFKTIAKVCDDTFQDTRHEKLAEIKSRHITYDTLKSMSLKYIHAFDQQVALKTVASAKRANIIREMTFQMLRQYAPGFKYIGLYDDGNIERLRKIVEKELMHAYVNTI